MSAKDDQIRSPMPGSEGQPTSTVRVGDTVRRPAAPWTPSVHAVLRHLERAGFSYSPRVVGDGFDESGNEVVTYLEGAITHPRAWGADKIWQVGRILRALHEAMADFRPAPESEWRPWSLRDHTSGAVISHCNIGPWHVLARAGDPVGLIDWSYTGPTDRVDEVAVTGWWNAQLYDDDIAERQHLPDAGARAEQLRSFLDGYRLPRADRDGLVTRMVEYAVHDCALLATNSAITPDSTDPTPLWTLAWQTRAASWLLRHRSMLERVITA
jgi:hypothetical protein